MKKTVFLLAFLVLTVLVVSPSLAIAQEAKDIQLPNPQMDGGRPLMQVLKERKSLREFSTKKLPLQVLSNLLWAANGINRPQEAKRTAPSAVNWQNIDIYVSLAEGLYVYDAKSNILRLILEEDVRATTGSQEFVKIAPLNLIYVADFSKISRGTDEDKNFYSAAHTGFISQNVYLFCASEGLSTVVRGLIDRQALAKVMKLRPDQKAIYAQTVGYPKE